MPKDGSSALNYVEKQRVRVVIQTSQQALIGFIYIHPGVRLKDNLNRKDEEWIAVTDVSLSGHKRKLPVVLLRAAEIVWLAPLEDGQEGFLAQ